MSEQFDYTVDQDDETEQSEPSEKEYVIDKKSTSDQVVVGKKILNMGGKAVALTQEEYDSVRKLEGVKLTEADKETKE